MPKLTVVFNYPDKSTMEGAKRAFDNQGETGAIPNLVGTATFDAIEKSGGYDKETTTKCEKKSKSNVVDINQKKP